MMPSAETSGELPKTPSRRSSHNLRSTHSGEYGLELET
jgi:hypothetical protein